MIGVKVTNVGLIFAIISLANHKPMLSFKKVAVKNQSLCRRFIFWGFRGHMGPQSDSERKDWPGLDCGGGLGMRKGRGTDGQT